MKIAPVHRALVAEGIEPEIVHTGQHYDPEMSRLFFEQLGIPEPDVNLEVGSGSHAQQTALIMQRFEPVLLERKPDLVVVVGDVNSTAACSLVAKKMPGIGVAHVEAGLRSGDRTMPEEINRIVTDSLSDLLFVSERSGLENLAREGAPPDRVHFVGNVMIDTLRSHLDAARATGAVSRFGLEPQRYALLTLHRPANVDRFETFSAIMGAVAETARRLPVLFPVHPRTRPALDRWLEGRRGDAGDLRVVPPVGYLEFLHLMSEARMVLTDSGGIQEETTALAIPCLTLRDNTERPATVTEGTNRLVGRDPSRILAAVDELLAGKAKAGTVPEKWDGRAAERIARVIAAWDGALR
ncbi:MAG: UDP-N-acetylglucosamine 2-epimerase (non-hydrolyzing) [Acidobacteria bacterium]|nr:MAG: UDP-N-acetylglucosamine 2-epimerase (non-hydrolyzing) [Acidobacteriota bacterium]